MATKWQKVDWTGLHFLNRGPNCWPPCSGQEVVAVVAAAVPLFAAAAVGMVSAVAVPSPMTVAWAWPERESSICEPPTIPNGVQCWRQCLSAEPYSSVDWSGETVECRRHRHRRYQRWAGLVVDRRYHHEDCEHLQLAASFGEVSHSSRQQPEGSIRRKRKRTGGWAWSLFSGLSIFFVFTNQQNFFQIYLKTKNGIYLAFRLLPLGLALLILSWCFWKRRSYWYHRHVSMLIQSKHNALANRQHTRYFVFFFVFFLPFLLSSSIRFLSKGRVVSSLRAHGICKWLEDCSKYQSDFNKKKSK